MALSVLKVSQLNKYVKSIIEYDTKLREIFVKGEISEFRVSYNGHAYFTLKDDKASVRCVMFSRNVDFLKFIPEEGMACIVRGYAGIYEQSGSFMLYAQDMNKCGAGEAKKELLNLKDKLTAEGFFDEKRKKPIPFFPKKVGVVTSLQGAAIGDIKKTIASLCPCVKLVISPAAVQGDLSAESICSAIEKIIDDGTSEVLIVGRGGGSKEDLSAFNAESVVKAVARCPIPVISAVGHEKDVTLCDLAADMRCATPTAAAAAAVPDIRNLQNRLLGLEERMKNEFQDNLDSKKSKLAALSENKYLKSIDYSISNKKAYMDRLQSSLQEGFQRNLDRKKRKLLAKTDLLNAYSPLNVLKRGFSYVEKDDEPVFSAKKISSGDELTIHFADGEVKAKAK